MHSPDPGVGRGQMGLVGVLESNQSGNNDREPAHMSEARVICVVARRGTPQRQCDFACPCYRLV